jgi:TPR repeat protein
VLFGGGAAVALGLVVALVSSRRSPSPSALGAGPAAAIDTPGLDTARDAESVHRDPRLQDTPPAHCDPRLWSPAYARKLELAHGAVALAESCPSFASQILERACKEFYDGRACERVPAFVAQRPLEVEASLSFSCNEGDGAACDALASRYEGTKPREARALRSYAQQLAESRAHDGGRLASTWQMSMDRVAPSVVSADRNMANPCDRGDAKACLAFAETLQSKHSGGDAAEVIAAERRACELGAAKACALLANRYANGIGVAKSQVDSDAFRARAIQLLSAECDAGEQGACLMAAMAARDE